jgi:hypothetical protein
LSSPAFAALCSPTAELYNNVIVTSRLEARDRRQSHLVLHRGEDILQHGLVPLGAHEVIGDLPVVADVRVGRPMPWSGAG